MNNKIKFERHLINNKLKQISMIFLLLFVLKLINRFSNQI
jgi:hypothetical protein